MLNIKKSHPSSHATIVTIPILPHPIPQITRRPHFDNEHTAVGRFSEVSAASFCDQKPMA